MVNDVPRRELDLYREIEHARNEIDRMTAVILLRKFWREKGRLLCNTDLCMERSLLLGTDGNFYCTVHLPRGRVA